MQDQRMADPPEIDNGLSDEQVRQRLADGLGNAVGETGRKTVGQIIASNVFTLFNLVNSLVFLLILLTGSYHNGLFMGVVLTNLLIGMIEEIRARRIIDRLRIITAASALVRRGGREIQILPEELVLDDVYILRPGSQVCADGLVLTSEELETDESLLTGESEPVRKAPGDTVLSGSFVVAGSALARVIRVGQNNYAQNMTLEAHRYKRAHSEILTNINRIIRAVSVLIVPVGLLLFASQFFRGAVHWREAIISSAAGIIGMIPEGLVLLTSITMTVGIIKLAYRRTVVQELAGLEVLARINVLCLDKTGTLTEGVLRVTGVVPLPGVSATEEETRQLAERAAAALAQVFPDRNSTGQALAARFPEAPDWTAETRVPFTSARMWSGASFSGQGSWLLGAPEALLSHAGADPALAGQVAALAGEGRRVILLARSRQMLETSGALLLPADLQPVALILLADGVRPQARAALEYFAKNDVTIKIITGDNPLTAVAVARELGLQHADRYLDMRTVGDDAAALRQAAASHTIFGRVSPWQKKQLIAAMQQDGKTVAMAGDGTNDVLAMHQADCSIVMATGSSAAKAMAHIALLDSDFTILPDVVNEGRQVINNVERVASLYLVKTTYSIILSLFFILVGEAYLFYPIHQTLLGMIGIGIPSFFLAMEKNTRRVQPGFLGKIIRTAIPGGVCIAVNLMLLKLLQVPLGIDIGQIRLIAVLITGIAMLLILLRVAWPLNRTRLLLLLAMAVLFSLGVFLLPLLWPGLLALPALQGESVAVIAGFALATYPLILLLSWLVRRLQPLRFQQ
jgi:cation-transporting P-type ATPase E